jgi:hypothetical protein
VTDDEDLAAQAILLSGSYMLYRSHLARPGDEVFERWKYRTPNLSLRMGNLPAALARPQLGTVLRDRCERWNQRWRWLAAAMADIPHLRVPARDLREQFVASSLQFSVVGIDSARIAAFIAACAVARSAREVVRCRRAERLHQFVGALAVHGRTPAPGQRRPRSRRAVRSAPAADAERGRLPGHRRNPAQRDGVDMKHPVPARRPRLFHRHHRRSLP